MKQCHLPHIDVADYYQFVTFRTQNSTDGFLKKLLCEGSDNRQKQQAIDDYLDRSKQGSYLNDCILEMLGRFFKSKNNDWYDLIAFSIMPNHVHLLIKPNSRLPLVMQKIKGVSAKLINEMMGKNGQFWAPDYYDKVIRDQKHFDLVYAYIKNNPLKLPDSENVISRFYGVYEQV